MRKLTAFLLLLCFMATKKAFTQNSSLKGTVVDTTNKVILKDAVITLLDRKDSSLVKFTRAISDGSFIMKDIVPGRYIVMISYPGYVEMMDTLLLKPNDINNFNEVALNTRAHILEEVIVRQTIAPIRFKGDTLIFTADSFKVKPGATVEDLLKVLPGFTVNSKGEITAQGQQVQKVYVDGEEFFGDDPTMATQNLNKKDVAQIQVFDKKTDQATLTGIDDGEKEKAINIVLKEDAKKGYFGRIEAGSDLNKYYQGKATANRFTSTMKAGGYIGVDRTGRNSMTWEDMENFGGFTPVEENGETYLMFENDSYSFFNSQGIPENLQSAFMLNKKYGKLKNNTANNYNFNRQFIAGNSYNNSQYILPDTLYYYNQFNSNKSTRSKHGFSTRNELNIDSFNTITINARAGFTKSSGSSFGTTEYLSEEKMQVNNSERTSSTDGTNNQTSADIFYKRKLNKTGTKSFTLNGGFTNNTMDNIGYLRNAINYFSNGLLDSTQVIDQLKRNNNKSTSYKLLSSYIQPLSKKAALNLNYSLNVSNSEQDIRTFEKMNTGKYDSLNTRFSNHFIFKSISHRGGITYTYNGKKIYFRAGLAMQDLSIRQTNLIIDSSYARNFINFFPSSNFRWKYSQSGSFSLGYSGSTQQPQLSQLQPILNNTDPLNLTIGNQDLKPSFNHSFNFSLNDYKVLTSASKSVWGYINFTENAFSSKTVVDNKGVRTTQTVNVNGNYNYYLSIGYGRKIKFLNLNYRLSPRISGSRFKSFVNGLENTTNTISISPSVSISKNIEKKLDAYLSYSPTYTSSNSTINRGQQTRYWIQNINLEFSYTILQGFQFNNNIQANYRQKLSPNDRNNNAFIWNISLEKKISKKKDLTALLSVNDLLNQQIGFNRNVSSNFISESTYDMVRRYAMFTIRWKFSKNRKQNDEDE
nr:TonB-dependent receptor [uncultured Sediminibacterium sp.]